MNSLRGTYFRNTGDEHIGGVDIKVTKKPKPPKKEPKQNVWNGNRDGTSMFFTPKRKQ